MEEDSDARPACDQPLEEEYIDMDLNSTTFVCYPINSPPEFREFEFRLSSNPADGGESIPSPADELFYKGNLLPLHLPPRLEMVQKLLQNPITSTTSNEKATDPLETNITAAAHNTRSITPSESFNSFPASTPCPISCCSAVLHRLRQMVQSSLYLKLRASRGYLNSRFNRYLRSLVIRSICSEGTRRVRKAEESSSAEEGRRNPSGQVRRVRDEVSETTTGRTGGEKRTGEEDCAHRFSFLGVMKHRLVDCSSSPSSASSRCSSSSSCSSTNENSNGSHGALALKRSSSVSSEGESFIQSAIAYCKKSLQSDCTRIGLGN